MPQKKDYIFFIKDDQSKPLIGDVVNSKVTQGDPDTLLGPDGNPAFLEFAPEKWQEIEMKYTRDTSYWGLLRSLTTTATFVRDGALILRWIFWKFGIEGFANIFINKQDKTIYPEIHKTYYISEFDFSTFKQDKIGDVSINLIDGGVPKYFKANENTVYDIPVSDDPKAVNVLMDGVDLDCTFNFQTYTDFGPRGSHLVPIDFINGEGTQLSLAHGDPVIAQSVSSGYQSTSPNWSLIAFAGTTMTIKGTLRIVPLTDSGSYTLLIRTSANRTQTLYSNPSVTSPTLNFDINQTFTINEGEKVFLEANWGGSLDLPYGIADVAVTFTNKFKSTIIKALPAFRLFELLMNKMSDGLYTVKSDFLTSLNDIVITSGDAIRGLPDASIKTSISDFFKSMKRFSVGLASEKDKLIIENINYFFKKTVSFDVGLIDELNIDPATDISFNTIKAGYQDQNYEDVNGRYEFNSSQQYSTTAKRVQKALDLISPYRADPYGIEFTRINLENKTTTDSSSDNDTFMLNIETVLSTDGTNTYYKLNRPAYDSLTGVPHPESIFNVELSPKRSILNNGPLLRSILDKMDAGYIKFESADKNSNLSTTQGSVTITEKDNVLIGSLGDRLFLPYYFTFTTSVPMNFVQLVKEHPYELIQFTWKGNTFYGYLWDGGIKPATNDKQQWKLLAAANNNMELLING